MSEKLIIEKITAWISKHALGKGIFVGEFCVEPINPNVISKTISDELEIYFTEGVEWHRTQEEAIKRADFMRIKRIQQLKKELDRLESLSFSA